MHEGTRYRHSSQHIACECGGGVKKGVCVGEWVWVGVCVGVCVVGVSVGVRVVG